MYCFDISLPEDNVVNISISHILLACLAAPGYVSSTKLYTHPGVHANYLTHGVLGFLHFRTYGEENNDFGPAYQISFYASRYLPLPCIVADIFKKKDNQALSTAFLLSGIIPFTLAITRSDDLHLDIGNAMMALNGVTLMYLSREAGRWAFFTAVVGLCTHFCISEAGRVKMVYPLALAVMEFGVYKLFTSPQSASDSGDRESTGRNRK